MDNTKPPKEQENSRFTEPGIVAVNARGAQGNDLAKKMLFVAASAGMLVVGGVYGFNKYRAGKKEAAAEEVLVSKAETRPAQVGAKRNFAADAPAPSASAAKAGSGAAAPADCPAVTVLDSAGKPLLGRDGQPIRVGCNGKPVPAIDPKAAPGTSASAGSAQPGGHAGGTAAKPMSRYGGDVLIQGQSATAQPGNRTSQPGQPGQDGQPAVPAHLAGAQALLQRIVAQQVGAQQGRGGDAGGPGGPGGAQSVPVAAQAQPSTAGGTGNQQGNVGALLTPTLTPKVTAAKIGDQNMLLAKGSQIDCALTTKVVNEVSGFASCLLSENVFSDNGKVLLLERGSKAEGEYVAAIQQGQRRLFVLWQRVRTPAGVVISLDSPAADGLGTMGLDGHVDNRWWDRLGAAFLLSSIKDLIAYEIAKSSNGANSTAGGAAYQNSTRTGEQMADRILSSTINIRPTIYKNQGDRASIYVARDLDFSTVYALRAN